MNRRKKNPIDKLDINRIEKLFEKIHEIHEPLEYDQMFIKLMQWMKSGKGVESVLLRIEYFIHQLKNDTELLQSVRRLVLHLFQTKKYTSLFTEIGVLNSSSFFSEMSKSFTKKILPDLSDKSNMKDLLEISFGNSKDFKKIQSVPNVLWIEMFKIIGDDLEIKSTEIYDELLDSLSILSFRILSFAYDEKVSQKWKASATQFNELLNQNQEINWLVHMYKEGRFEDSAIEEQFQRIESSISSCKSLVSDIKHNSVLYGTSLEQSYSIAKAEQQLNRILNLLQLLKSNSNPEQLLHVIVMIFNKTVEHINKEKKMTYVFSQSVELLAYQVSEHKRETGEHYITSTKDEYWTLFWSSVKGGLVICLAASIKVLLHYVHTPIFWSYFLYGLNYAAAFCFMYLTHATLATKQPAMTAAALAHAMDHKNENFSGSRVSITLARVWRSQFISFVGNLLIVIPMCMAIAMVWNFATHEHFMRPYDYAQQGLNDQSPLKSIPWIYASITGVLLFLSGIISGYVDNKVIYGNIPARIKAHPRLLNNLSEKQLNAFSTFVRKHWGSIVGNVFLGFALGYAPFIGELFGIPFDIRHITISAAYLGFGVVGTEFSWSFVEYLIIAIGVIGVGAFNFMVSFGLAFLTAMRSRRVPIKSTRNYLSFIKKHLRKYPLDFIFPPKKTRIPEDLM